MNKGRYKIYIDTGGTFTDCIAIDSEGNTIYNKVLSSGRLRGRIEECLGPGSFRVNEKWELSRDIIRAYDFLIEGHRNAFKIESYDIDNHILRIAKGAELSHIHPGSSFEITAHEEAPVLATRLVTQTGLDEKFPDLEIRLGSTRGTNALLENKGARTALITTRGFKDLLRIGDQTRPDIFSMAIEERRSLAGKVIEIDERIDSNGKVLRAPDTLSIRRSLRILKNENYESVAVALLNSYQNPSHEQQIKELLEEQGFRYISLSSELSSLIKLLERTETSLVNAYLSPIIFNYLGNISSSVRASAFKVMTSSGGMRDVKEFHPKDSLLSGPAGGVVGASVSGRQCGFSNLISFDMGGTSTDVSRYSGAFDYCYELKVGNARVMSPALSIETVAAGGGSICDFDGYKLSVGPESAGAIPGPACYGAGGPLTLTDINLLAGRLSEKNFSIPVNIEAAEDRLESLLQKIERSTGKTPHKSDIIEGFISIANETMAGAIRKISLARGYDPREFSLVSFGGAGGLHACGISANLGIRTIINPPEAGLLSALGIANAPLERFAVSQILADFQDFSTKIDEEIRGLSHKAREELKKEGIEEEKIHISKVLLYLRYRGQDSSLGIEYNENTNILDKYREKYQKLYGHTVEDRSLELETIRVVASEIREAGSPGNKSISRPSGVKDEPHGSGENHPYPIYFSHDITKGQQIKGPALLLNDFSTFFLEANWEYTVDPSGNGIARMAEMENPRKPGKEKPEEAELELFSHRFMSIAENMGAMLQRTALSVNIKERLDFSCALLDAEGYLVANAPHIPVHLGGLGICVRELLKKFEFRPGDTIVTNHPAYGGSHLPDITTISPVYGKKNTLIAFVVNRAHHSEIGGLSPGSMPPSAKNLAEEGVVIPPFYLVRENTASWKGIEKILRGGPYPSRAVNENLADLNASLAANLKGIQEMSSLVDKFGEEKVLYYFRALKNYASGRMSEKLQKIPSGVYNAREVLDDGSPLVVNITREGKDTVIDFEGSAPVSEGNMNATPAIVHSVVIYVLRLILNEAIPLNDGLLAPVHIYLPEGMLNPLFPENAKECPAVVGGNVEISQRLTDCVLKAFGTMAASQGTMNNVLFGNNDFGYYETLAGGTGAGEGFEGRDASHHHMTNTRITDPEIMEFRYPVRIIRFEIRRGSGGKGKWKGGNGLVREYEFLSNVNLSLMSQRRNSGPYGLKGGKDGTPGEQAIIRKDGSRVPFSGIDNSDMKKGDRFIIMTPGGGGYGRP